MRSISSRQGIVPLLLVTLLLFVIQACNDTTPVDPGIDPTPDAVPSITGGDNGSGDDGDDLDDMESDAEPDQGKEKIKQETFLFTLPDFQVVNGAVARLARTDDALFVKVKSQDLTPDDAVTLWIVVFNRPENCTGGPGGGLNTCGDADFFNPAVEADLMFLDGTVIKPNGKGKWKAKLETGDTSPSVLPAVVGLPAVGLTNPLGAEVHLVMHSHGPVIPGLEEEMTSTFGAGCNNVPPGTGTPGPNTCVDLQAAILLAP